MGIIPYSEKQLEYIESWYTDRQNQLLHGIINSDILEETAREIGDDDVC